jgi:hypothetical protein
VGVSSIRKFIFTCDKCNTVLEIETRAEDLFEANRKARECNWEVEFTSSCALDTWSPAKVYCKNCK